MQTLRIEFDYGNQSPDRMYTSTHSTDIREFVWVTVSVYAALARLRGMSSMDISLPLESLALYPSVY